MNKRQTGTDYESLAAKYLVEQGFTIVEKNYRNRTGEIDLIAEDGEYLCFVEVKYRKDNRSGYPAEAVDYRKQRTITRVAMHYLTTHGYSEWTPCRFDVVSIEGEKISLIKNAYEVV